jgi:hypothetical protein
MSLKLLKHALISSFIALGIIFSGQVQAHGGLALADDLCILTVGPYTIHFTGYQPLTQEEEFCEDIPEIGKTVVALDYINDELRPYETEVRIIRDTGSEDNLDEITVLHMPPEVYPSASILIDHTFPAKGNFVGLVTVSLGDEEHVSRFPFSVGEGTPIDWWFTVLPAALLVGTGAFLFLRSRSKPKDGASA